MGFTDTAEPDPGSTHQYRVQVTDPFGNVANSPWTTVTVAPQRRQGQRLRQGRLRQPADELLAPRRGGRGRPRRPTGWASTRSPPRPASPAVPPGAISGDSDTASTLQRCRPAGRPPGATAGNPPDVFTLETWFKTTSTTGGRIVGWSHRNTTSNSTKHDRQLYMDNGGRLHFGVKPDATAPGRQQHRQLQRRCLAPRGGDPVGVGHEAVRRRGAGGVARRRDRGGAPLHRLLAPRRRQPGQLALVPTSGYFNGSLDEVAIYKHELSAVEIAGAPRGRHRGSDAQRQADRAVHLAGHRALEHLQLERLQRPRRHHRVVRLDLRRRRHLDGRQPVAHLRRGRHLRRHADRHRRRRGHDEPDQAGRRCPPRRWPASRPASPGRSCRSTGRAPPTTRASRRTPGPSGTAAPPPARPPSHTYAAGGTYDVKLTVTDATGNTATRTQQVTIVAAQRGAGRGLHGDGQRVDRQRQRQRLHGPGRRRSRPTPGRSATGAPPPVATASHTYAAAGTYTVTLEVTDDDGAKNTATQQVTVAAARPGVRAGLLHRAASPVGGETADLGGAWTGSGTASNFNVAGGVGTIRMGSAGSGPSRAMTGVSSSNTEMRATIGVDKVATGGGIYVTLRPRHRGRAATATTWTPSSTPAAPCR